MKTLKVKILKFDHMVSHEVGDIVEFQEEFALKHIEKGFAEPIETIKPTEKATKPHKK